MSQAQPQIDPVLIEQSTGTSNNVVNKRKENVVNKRKENVADEATGRKKKAKTTGSITDFDKAKYKLVGRKLVCLSHPFGSPRTAIKVGMKIESGCEGELDDNSVEIERHHRFYEGILTHALGLAEELNSKRLEANDLHNICAWVTKGMSDQCSTDLGSVKHAGLAYLFANGKLLAPSIAKSEDKSMRGFNHPEITHMLCPQRKLDVFDEDPDVIIGALQEGTIKTTAASWPTCFYEEGVYDLENRAKGLFRGHSAFRFYTHLFIRPSAASTDTITSNSSKVSKNCAWGLTEVTPHVIAYVHILLYFTLSTAPRWCTTIGQMDLAEMAWAIIEMFNEKDDWTKETLAWWNSRAFPKGHGSSNNADSDDDMANIRAQRTRKKAACPPSASEKRATEATDFATPSPEDLKNPLPTDPSLLSSGDPSIPSPSSGNPSIPSSRDPSILSLSSGDPSGPSPSNSDASSSEGSSIFSGSAAAVIESDLSSCTSDNEADPTPTVYTGKTNTAGPSTVTSAPTSIPAPAPPSNSDPSIIPTEPKKKGHAPATKKPHRRGGKKSNGF